jgi:hypothetical protein
MIGNAKFKLTSFPPSSGRTTLPDKAFEFGTN